MSKNNISKNDEILIEDNINLINRSFDEIIAEGFNRYAKYIIQDRALPELKDGLKPVQRRILYAMYKLNLLPNSQFKKSARTVGDVLGKYHPHGDSSIYEALIRMAQDWKNNLPQIEVHGNKGSIDDDPPAAMRYTEARLSVFGKELLRDIDKKIYPFINNFDDTETEPTILSSLLPNLLINGASGIAAGYATSIPTFNIKELISVIIAKIKNPEISLNEILKIMPGPDFPTGGIILNQNEIKKCYTTGDGKITIRSSYIIQNNDKKNEKKIIITSIPYETIKSNIVKQIEDLRSDNKLHGVVSVVDASDKNGIAIELEISNSLDEDSIESIMSFLYKKTELQVNFNANMIVINERKPVKIGVLDYIDLYLKHAINCIIKVESFLLKEDEDRYEVVLGLIKAISILDEIIIIIRQSKDKQDSINNLINRFEFTQKQAEAIVNLRLYRLSNTDISLLEKEKDDLSKNIEFHKLIINNKQEQDKYLILQLEQYLELFNDYNRRSKIIKHDKLDISNTNEKDLILSKDVYVVISKFSQIKYVSKIENDKERFSKINFKNDNDSLKFIFKSNLKSSIILFTNLGRVVSIDTFKLLEAKWKDNGEDLINKLHLLTNEKIIACFDSDELNKNSAKYIILSTKLGKMKRLDKSNFISEKEIRLSSCINLDEQDELRSVCLNNDIDDLIFIISKNGYVLKFDAILIPLVSNKAKGINAIKLENNDELIKAISINQTDKYIDVFTNESYKTLLIEEIKKSNRNIHGINILNKRKQNIIDAFVANDQKIYYAYSKNNVYIDLSNLSIRNTNNWSSFNENIAFIKQIDQIK